MAELDDKLLKNLDKTLASMNQRLQGLEQTLAGVKEGMMSAFNPAIIKSFTDSMRGLKAIRLIEADEAVKDIKKIKDEIDSLESKYKGEKPLKKGESLGSVREELSRYKALMREIDKGSEQRAIELANIRQKERDADLKAAEVVVSQREHAERRKAEIARAWAEQEAREKAQREKMKTASEKAAADERTAIAEAEAKKKSEIAKAWAEQDRRRYEKDGDPLGEIAARKGLTGTLAALEDQTAVNEWRKQTAEEQKRIAKEEAEVEKQIKKEIAEEEKKLAAEEKQRYQDAVAANKAMTKAEDDLAEAKRKARTAESKAAYTEDTKQRIEEERKAARERAQQAKEAAAIQKKADAESMANQRRQIQIKSQISAIDKNRISITKQSSDREKALAAQQQADYRSLRSELSKLIARQKELNAVSQGSGIRAKDRLSTYTISESEKAMRRYADAVRNAHREQKKLGDETNKMLPTLQRLASAFGVAFSVRGLAQFAKQLVKTRGEFEMQFVAMKQIIGDVDAATKIWNQTMQQALQSPFKAMQLVTYTKQLAAYRIETEKLFDTTKRLANISAGLGVDMGRLILAYGQVKSANFLRASEVRQFTEAGVNIVGNLAQYFTELEGRAVSTADVMERITKRMVMFSDVEEIFRRMTDEGGEFYKMQEIQADTVKGQINKLHDAYDQMLNTIGQANQGTLRNYIESLNELVRNWRTVASFIMKNVNAMVILVPLIATYRKGAKMAAGETFTWSRAMKQLELELAFGRAGIKKFSLSTALGTAAVYTFKGAIELTKMALRTFVPFIAIEGLMWLVTKMGEADRNAKQLAKSLDEVGSKNASSLQENIDGFTDLVERLKQANEGSQDYLDIRNKIQSQYGEYLDNLELEQITVENLAKSYDKVVERMREKSRQHIMEEGLQEIADAYGDALVKFQKELKGTKLPNGMKVNDKEAADIAKKMYDLYSKDEFYRSGGSSGLLLGKVLREYYGVSGELNLSLKTAKDFQKAIESRYKSQIDLETKANALTKATSDTHQEYLDQLNAEEEHEKKIAEILADASIKSSGRRELAIQAEQLRYEEKKLELQAQYQKKSDEWLKTEKTKLKENYGAFLNAYNEQVKAYIGGRFGEGWMQGDNSDAWKAYNFMIANQDRLSQGQTKWEEKILNDKKLTEENIQRIKEQQATQTAADSEAAKALNESLKQEEDRLELIKKQMELLGLHEKQKGGSGSANNSIYGERIRLLQDMLQKYKQLAKEAYGYAKAEGKVSESFEDAWNSIMPAGYGDLEVPTSYKVLAEMLQRLEAFTPAFDKNGQLSKMLADLKKAVSDALSQVDIELSVRFREDFGKQMEKSFNDYELTLELDKLNISPEAAKDLFPAFDPQTLGQMQDIMKRFYEEKEEQGVAFDEDDLKEFQKWADKIDAEILKSRKDRAKEYSRFLEKEYSERAKVEMQYAKDVAFVTANFSGQQQKNILEGLNDKFQKDISELNWKSFKESSFYVEMMDDLSSVPIEYMKIMLSKIEEILQNPEALPPRALKEAINARQKIIEAQMDFDQIAVMKESMAEIREAAKDEDVGGKNWRQTKKRLDEEQKAQAEKLAGIEQEIRANEKLQGQLKGLEDRQKAFNDARKDLSSETISDLGELNDPQSLMNEYEADIAVWQKRVEELKSAEGEATSETKDEIVKLEERIRLRQIEIGLLEKYKESLRGLGAYESTEEGQAAVQAQGAGQTSTSVGGKITQGKKDAENVTKRLSTLQKWQKAFKNFNDSFSKFNKNAADMVGRLGALSTAAFDLYDALGGETDAMTEAWKEFGGTIVNTITQALTMIPTLVAGFVTAGTAINAAMGIIGLIAEAIQLVLVLITGLAKLHDAGYEAEIERQQKKIDELQRAYDRLEKQIEKTWDTASYIRTYNEETQNLYAQIEALNKQIAAENAKKDTDADKIQGYKDSIRDAEDELEELKQKQIEVFGGIGEEGYRDAAQEFVDAWKSAFLETGDGLQGLQEHFDEFLNDWFVKQATMRVAGRMLEPLFRQIDSAVDQYSNGGANVLMQELQEVREKFGVLAPQLSEALEELAGMWGLGGEGALSGLAAGIQGMTEEQANILEAYWNSVRGYTASIDFNVARIADMMASETEGRGVDFNPMLQQLNLIAANTQATHQLLLSVTKSGHSQGGYGIKVFAD